MKHIRKPGYDFLQEARNSCGGGGGGGGGVYVA